MEREHDTLGKRLRSARKRVGMTQTQLATAAGVPQSDISKIERGDTEKTTHLARLAHALGVSPRWLDTGEGGPDVILVDGGHRLFGVLKQAIEEDMPPDEVQRRTLLAREQAAHYLQRFSLIDDPEYPQVPLVEFKLAAGATGFGIDMLHDPEAKPIVFRRSWYQSHHYDPAKLFAITVSGESMQPGLWAGDVVVVNTEDTRASDGAVFAFNYEGELVIKRLVRDEGAWWLVSDNPDQRRFPRKRAHDAVSILGRVVHKQSEHI